MAENNENLPCAESMALSAIDNARTSAIIDTMKAQGKSQEEVAKAVMGNDEDIASLARSVVLVNLLKAMGDLFGLKLTHESNRAFVGYACINHHYPHRAEAVAWMDLHNNGKCVRDVWQFFLQANEIADDAVTKLPGYDPIHFSGVLDMPLGPGAIRAFSIQL